LSYNGEWRGHRWFCSDCLRNHRISDADTKGSKRKRGIPNEKTSAMDLLFGNRNLTPQEKIERQIKEIVSLPNIHDTHGKYIDRNGIFRVKTNFKPNSYMLSGGDLKKYYAELMNKKVLKDDPTLRDDIIKFREKLLQHRILCDVVLHGKEGVVGRLKVYKVLIEHGQEIVDYWIGKSIDPSSFNTLVKDFHNFLYMKHMVGDVSVTQYPMKWSTVHSVETEFEFA
jgi:hypothetical protein